MYHDRLKGRMITSGGALNVDALARERSPMPVSRSDGTRKKKREVRTTHLNKFFAESFQVGSSSPFTRLAERLAALGTWYSCEPGSAKLGVFHPDLCGDARSLLQLMQAACV